jgi:lysophospholipase L1-like esterase
VTLNQVALCLLFAFQVFSYGAIAKNSCLGHQLKVVAIGDSITQGGNYPNEYTYRLPLFNMLKDAGYEIDFIGTQRTGLNKSFKWPEGFDADHEGFYGATTSALQKFLMTDLAKLPPADIALIHLGTSDFGSYNIIKSVVYPMHSIILQLRKRNPNVRILISQVHLYGLQAKYLRLHLNLLAIYAGSEKSPVQTVPDYIDFTEYDTFDGMHPNITGQKKMAKAWFNSINEICNNE